MCDGRTVARGRRAAGTGGKRRAADRNRRLGRRRRGRGLRGARVQARLGRRTDGRPTAQIEPKSLGMFNFNLLQTFEFITTVSTNAAAAVRVFFAIIPDRVRFCKSKPL